MPDYHSDHRQHVSLMFEALKAAQSTSDGDAKLAHFEASGRHSLAACQLSRTGQASACDKSTITASSFFLSEAR
jgi:hypothetical protein